LRAPIGYLDNGSAKPKTIDPAKGPLVRDIFALYATGHWSIPTLVEELHRRGLRNHAGGTVTRTGLHTILRSRFYTGVMHIRASGQTFEGNHKALITTSLYERVQDILHGRIGTRVKTHDFLFRRFIRCVHCKNALIGELQKGHVYYRCHTRTCPTTNIREEVAGDLIAGKLKALEFAERERAYLACRIAELKAAWIRDREQELQNLKVKIEQVTERLNRVTDAYLDAALDREMFEERKAKLVQERRALTDRRADFEANRASVPDELRKCVELAQSAYSLYQSASTEKKRRLLRIVVSNCAIDAKKLDFTWAIPFQQIAEREKDTDGAPSKEIPRTLENLLGGLLGFFAEHVEVDFWEIDALS
jgi:site-specific DNA recombinase